METPDERSRRQSSSAKRALPPLEVVADKIEQLMTELFTTRIPYKPSDGASVMALTFVTKQREHMRSVRLLIDAGQHRDSELIARTMIEGMARLLWAFNDSPKRTELWLWFGAILDWRQTLRNEAENTAVDQQEKEELKKLVDQHGPNYYRKNVEKEANKAAEAGTIAELPSDPWTREWTNASVESMFIEVDGRGLYEGRYRYTSEWIHWGPRAIFRAIQPAEWGVAGFQEVDWRSAISALQMATQSQMQCLQVLDYHYKLGISVRINELYEEVEAIAKGI